MNLQIDNSSMEAYSKCPVYYAMNRIHNYQPKEPVYYFVAGHAFHKLFENFFQGLEETQIFQNFEAELEPFTRIPDCPPSHSPENLRKIARSWFDTHKKVEWPWRPVFVEKGFKIKNFIEGVDLVGRLDYLGQNMADNAWVLQDWKTTGNLDVRWERSKKTSSQLCCYTYAVQTVLGHPLWHVYIAGLEIKVVPSSDKICRGSKNQEGHGVPYSQCGGQHVKFKNLSVMVTQEKLDVWREDATKICQGIVDLWKPYPVTPTLAIEAEPVKKLPMTGMFNNGCYNCPYQDWCHIYNRRTDVLPNLFKQEKFDPLAGSEVFEVTL